MQRKSRSYKKIKGSGVSYPECWLMWQKERIQLGLITICCFIAINTDNVVFQCKRLAPDLLHTDELILSFLKI